jgi:Asp-tRNA(Asn)/Glu-tRNA(Gln) amidotransferase C subunit
MAPLSLEAMRELAALNGFQWTDAELEALRPALERVMGLLARLEGLALEAVEPSVQHRVR